MASFFSLPLTVTQVDDEHWKVAVPFTFFNPIYNVSIPQNFVTDFASIPRLFWNILPPDGIYAQAAVVHDFLYQTQPIKRKQADQILLEGMKVLKVEQWKRLVIYNAVRLFGWLCIKKPISQSQS